MIVGKSNNAKTSIVTLSTWTKYTDVEFIIARQSFLITSYKNFRYYETGSPFEYTLVSWLYNEMREIQIAE